jgi:hypothetical protein
MELNSGLEKGNLESLCVTFSEKESSSLRKSALFVIPNRKIVCYLSVGITSAALAVVKQ